MVLSFGRYMIKEGAKPINGPNDDEGQFYNCSIQSFSYHYKSSNKDYHLYQEFYKRKTKITKEDFENLKKIIENYDIEQIKSELENNFTVQCSKYWPNPICHPYYN